MYMYVERYKDHLEVKSVTDKAIDDDHYIEILDDEKIDKIKYNLKNNVSVYLLDDFNEEQNIFNLYFNKSDLDMYKIIKIADLRKTFESGTVSNKLHGGSVEFTMIYYNIVIILNKLANKGFLFEDDKNELYLQILESNDEEMIVMLENFLEYNDQLKRSSFLYEKMSNTIKKIESMESKEDVDLILDVFNKNGNETNYNMM